METLAKNKGFVEPEILPDQYTFGAQLPVEILEPNGDWTPYLPREEKQFGDSFDSMNCTNYATLNALEMLLRRKYGEDNDFSERFLGVVSDTTRQGNNPQSVAEAIRSYGLIFEALLPFDETVISWNDYYNPKPMLMKLLELAKRFSIVYDFKHDWVVTDKPVDPSEIEHALKSSPLGASVGPWTSDADGAYNWTGAPIHYVCIVNCVPGQYWEIFDQYPPFIKKVAWNAPFRFVKRYTVRKRTQKEQDEYVRSELSRILELLRQILNSLLKQVGKSLGFIQ